MVWVDVFVTFLKVLFTAAFGIWILWMIVWGFFKLFNKQRRVWFKYSILRKPYNEDDVAWCMEAHQKGLKEIDLRKHLLLNNTSSIRVEEIVFIFRQIRKELMKGGELEHGGSEESNAKIELPKI